MNNFIEILQHYPELALFLVLALGFAIGKISIGNFKVGAVLGTLFAGVLIELLTEAAEEEGNLN